MQCTRLRSDGGVTLKLPLVLLRLRLGAWCMGGNEMVGVTKSTWDATSAGSEYG